MEKSWSKSWKASSQARKQRKYSHNAPLHIKHKMLSSPLDKELRKEHGVRSLPIRKGDEVQIMVGQFKGHKGRVEKVSLAKMCAYVEGAALKRADDTESLYPIHPSNLKIVKLELGDKRRNQKIERMNKKE